MRTRLDTIESRVFDHRTREILVTEARQTRFATGLGISQRTAWRYFRGK